jgi:hypothetical protein
LKVFAVLSGLAVISIFAFGFWVRFSFFGCTEEITNTASSPDDQLAAVVYRRECRDGIGTSVVIIPKSAIGLSRNEMPPHSLVFVLLADAKLGLEWKGPKELSVTYPQEAFVKYLERNLRDVTINYKGIQ